MEIDPLRQIQSVSDFRSKTDKILEVLDDLKTVLLTHHGKTCAILVDPKAYEEQQGRLRLAEKILKSHQEIAQGKGIDHDDVERLSKDWI